MTLAPEKRKPGRPKKLLPSVDPGQPVARESQPDPQDVTLAAFPGPSQQEILRRLREAQEKEGESMPPILVEKEGVVTKIEVPDPRPLSKVVREIAEEQRDACSQRILDLEAGVRFIFNISRGFGGNYQITRKCQELLSIGRPPGSAPLP